MKQFFAPIIVVACVFAGGTGGLMLKGSQTAPLTAEGMKAPVDGDTDAGHAKDDGHASAKPDKSKDSYASASSSDVIYYKFSREFVVPIMQDGKVKSLVLLNISLEADSKLSDKLFSMEPKLRDNIMTTLISLSSESTTFANVTSVDSYETIRSMILMNLKSVVSTGIQNVLILDMAKQDL